MIEVIIAISLLSLLLYAYFLFYPIKGLFSKYNEILSNGEVSGISVVIPFRNEEEKLESLYKSLSSQKFDSDKVEFIFIDDNSSDKGFSLLSSLTQNSKKGLFHIVRLERETGKKAALWRGIEMAKFNKVLALDADVTLSSSYHLIRCCSYFDSNELDFAIGSVLLEAENELLNQWQCFENLVLQGLTGAYSNIGKPLLCNGAHLMFKKENVVKSDLSPLLASGDDMFLLQSSMEKGLKIAHLPWSLYVITTAKNSLIELISQRVRWSSKSSSIKNWRLQAFSFNVLFTNLLTLSFIPLGFLYPEFVEIFISLTAIKYFIDILFLFLTGLRVRQSINRWFLIPCLIMNTFLYPIIGILALTGGFEWKGRKYKK